MKFRQSRYEARHTLKFCVVLSVKQNRAGAASANQSPIRRLNQMRMHIGNFVGAHIAMLDGFTRTHETSKRG